MKLEKWQGPPHINTQVKQDETINNDLSPLTKMSSLTLHTAPLTSSEGFIMFNGTNLDVKESVCSVKCAGASGRV